MLLRALKYLMHPRLRARLLPLAPARHHLCLETSTIFRTSIEKAIAAVMMATMRTPEFVLMLLTPF